jgi:glycosyltransferase involved in cell wall biosynthesis
MSPVPAARRHPPRLLFLVTEDWIFYGHRLPTARAARDAGFEVVVAARIADHGDRITAEGFRLVPLSWQRRNFNPFQALRDILDIAAVYRREAPDIVHHVALKPVVFGGLAAWLARVPAVVAAVTGLGSAFTGTGRKLTARLAGHAARLALGPVLHRPNSITTVENPDDAAFLIDAGLVPASQITVIRGSGVDIVRYQPLPEPAGPVTVGIAARLLANKGIEPLVQAQQQLVAGGLDLRLIIAGTPDPDSPTSIPPATLAAWRGLPGIELAGQIDDIRTLWARCHIACLPSRGGEGIPMSLLEAAACGRALVATDVPGCREITVPNRNGILVPVDDVDALAAGLRRLAADASLRQAYGAKSRQLVESDLAADRVAAQVVAVYRSLLNRR